MCNFCIEAKNTVSYIGCLYTQVGSVLGKKIVHIRLVLGWLVVDQVVT